MPIYEYKCEDEHRFEAFQPMADDPLEECEVCGAPVQRVLSAPAVHFKGSGFYTTDYARKGRKGGGSDGGSEGGGESSGSDGGGSDKKSESGSKSSSGSDSSGNGSSSSGSEGKSSKSGSSSSD